MAALAVGGATYSNADTSSPALSSQSTKINPTIGKFLDSCHGMTARYPRLSAGKEVVVTDWSPELQSLVDALQALLSAGTKKHFAGLWSAVKGSGTTSFYNFVREFTARDTLSRIDTLHLLSPRFEAVSEKEVAWIIVALNELTLPQYFEIMKQNRKLAQTYYHRANSIVLASDAFYAQIQSGLTAIDYLDFRLEFSEYARWKDAQTRDQESLSNKPATPIASAKEPPGGDLGMGQTAMQSNPSERKISPLANEILPEPVQTEPEKIAAAQPQQTKQEFPEDRKAPEEAPHARPAAEAALGSLAGQVDANIAIEVQEMRIESAEQPVDEEYGVGAKKIDALEAFSEVQRATEELKEITSKVASTAPTQALLNQEDLSIEQTIEIAPPLDKELVSEFRTPTESTSSYVASSESQLEDASYLSSSIREATPAGEVGAAAGLHLPSFSSVRAVPGSLITQAFSIFGWLGRRPASMHDELLPKIADHLPVPDSFEAIDMIAEDHNQLSANSPELTLRQPHSLTSQRYLCFNCGNPIGFAGESRYKAKYCDISGRYYCNNPGCHEGETVLSPARIVLNWEFEPVPASHAAAHDVIELSHSHHFVFEQINPYAFLHVPELAKAKVLRGQLFLANYFVSHCPDEDACRELLKAAWPKEHLVESKDLYSIEDLIDANAGTLCDTLSNILASYRAHIKLTCEFCRQRGERCGICDNGELLYAFETESVFECADCNGIMHRKCRGETDSCTNCLKERAQADTSAPQQADAMAAAQT